MPNDFAIIGSALDGSPFVAVLLGIFFECRWCFGTIGQRFPEPLGGLLASVGTRPRFPLRRGGTGFGQLRIIRGYGHGAILPNDAAGRLPFEPERQAIPFRGQVVFPRQEQSAFRVIGVAGKVQHGAGDTGESPRSPWLNPPAMGAEGFANFTRSAACRRTSI